jgi:hypothetical protein
MKKNPSATLLVISALLVSGAAHAQEIEATTASGEKVRLLPNGRWEYVNQQKAVAQRQAVEADLARERSSQGGFFGLGRRVYEGDKDFNRGTLNPKMR